MVEEFEDASTPGCEKCIAFTQAIVAIAPFILLGGIAYVMYITPRSPLDEHPTIQEIQNALGQLIMFIQVINACFAAGMQYGEPLNSLSDNVIAELDPDNIF
jgi:hypothetical protein